MLGSSKTVICLLSALQLAVDQCKVQQQARIIDIYTFMYFF